MLSALAVAVPLMTLGAHVLYEVGLRTEARARSPLSRDVATQVASDIELAPRAVVGADWGRTWFGLTYTPRILLSDAQAVVRPDVLHTGRLALESQIRPTRRLLLGQQLSYGVTEMSLLSDPTRNQEPGVTAPTEPDPAAPTDPTTTPGQNTERVPSLRAVEFFQSESLAGIDFQLTPLNRLVAHAGYSVSGGIGPSQLELPLQRGPLIRSTFTSAVSRADTLTTLLNASHSDFVTGARATIAVLSEEWQHRLGRYTAFRIGAGLSGTWTRDTPVEAVAFAFLPVTRIQLTHQLMLRGQRVDLGLNTDVAPSLDRFSGVVTHRSQVSVTGTYFSEQDFQLTARAGTSMALRSSDMMQDMLGTLELKAIYQAHRLWAFEGGMRGAWQTYGDSSASFLWLAYVSITFKQQGAIR